MKNLKSLVLTSILALATSFTFANTVSAAVNTQHVENGNSTFDIAIVELSNKPVQNKINEEIIAAYPSDSNQSNPDDIAPAEVIASYDVKYEDNNYLSLVIRSYEYFEGAAHGMSYTDGMVFDKTTGNKLPLKYFLNVPSMDRFYADLDSGRLPLFNSSMEPIVHAQDFTVPTMPTSYYLTGNGGLCVIFQPYALGPYSDGTTYVYFSREMINSYNKASLNR